MVFGPPTFEVRNWLAKLLRGQHKLFLMEKEGCLRRQSQEPGRRGPEHQRTMDGGPAELHPRGLGNTRLARFQNSHESMPAMWIPSVPFLNGSIYCNYPALASHCLLNMCRAYHLCHLKFSRSRGATAWELPRPHLDLIEITGLGISA